MQTINESLYRATAGKKETFLSKDFRLGLMLQPPEFCSKNKFKHKRKNKFRSNENDWEFKEITLCG